MNEKYIIKIYDKSLYQPGMRIEYFHEENFTYNSYYDTPHTRYAEKFTKEQAQETIKYIEKAHKDDPKNGILDHIEILNVDTLEIIEIIDFNKVEEIDRFELMDFD